LVRDFPDTAKMVDNPKRATEKYSTGENFSAILERGGERKIITPTLNNPPIVPAIQEILMAVPAFPLRASAYPSNMVTAEAGAPGVRMVMAVTELPYIPPL
jgi:hypothetical protein